MNENTMKAVCDYLATMGLKGKVVSHEGRDVVQAREHGRVLGVITVSDKYADDVTETDWVKEHLARQQAAEQLRTRPGERGKYLVLGFNADGQPWIEEVDR